jgi:minor extracellular serine protease Vpr
VGTKSGGGSFSLGAALGDFDGSGAEEPDGKEAFVPAITAAYTVTTPANGCTTISTALAGKIAVIDRGVCTFSTKVRNAQAAGAVGVLVVNNVAGDPTAMGHDGLAFPTIPAVMLGKAEGASIKPSGTVTVDGTTAEEFLTENEDIIAGFSGRGPTPFTALLKPEVVAPGVNVYSSVFGNTFAFFQGTSMATPHVAGSAALLLDLHPNWSPDDVKSALANTGARVVTDHINGTTDPGVLARGGGRIDLDAASASPVSVSPALASFGFWNGNKETASTLTLTLRSLNGSASTCSVATTGSTIVKAGASSVSVPASGTASLTLSLNAGKESTSASGDRSGDVVFSCNGTELKAPWWVRISRQGKP